MGKRAEAVRGNAARRGITIVPYGAPDYPPPLREIPGAPLVLYRLGEAWGDGVAVVALVGSRAPTGPGREFARRLSGELAEGGILVVSGMARGIDAAAHRGALRGGGKTIAVLGCGPDVAYPLENEGLREEIAASGAVYSEYPPGSLPLQHRFPARNRILSGMSRGVIVAEAPARSGALITARFALDQGREVMAVPGSPWFAHTEGSNRLLREGAIPVCSADDVRSALGVLRKPNDLAGEILDLLARERHATEIAAMLSRPLGEVLSCLMEMELANLVVKRAGDYYKRKSERRG